MSASTICRISPVRSVPSLEHHRGSIGVRPKSNFLQVFQSPFAYRSPIIRTETAMLDHISIGVRDIARTRRFYDAALAPLGYKALSASETSLGYGAGSVVLWISAI